MGTIIPDQVETDVTYTCFKNLKNAANYYFAQPFYSNAPYDADPSVGSTATVGHAEMTALYNRCRAVAYTVEIHAFNIGSYPVSFIVLHNNLNRSAAGGSAVDFLSLQGNRFTQMVVLGHATGPAKAVLRARHTIEEISGSKEVLTDDNYASLTTTIPANVTFVEVGIYSDPTAPVYPTQGVSYVMKLTYHTRYFERKQFNS